MSSSATRPRRILLVTSDLAPRSGWGTFSRTTVEGLLAAGCEVRVLCHERVEHAVMQVPRLPSALSLIDARAARLWAACVVWWQVRRWRPDVVHVLVEPYALCLPLVARLGALPPWVLNLHATYAQRPFAYAGARPAWEWVYRHCPAFLVCSAYTEGRSLEAVRVAMGESVMTDVARRMHRFSFGIASAAPLSRLPRSTPERHLLCVGAIKPRKGLVELVRAFSTYVRRTPEPRLLHLVGTYDESSSYIQELRRVMVEEGVENRVVLHGRVSADELERLYQLADLFVMLSISTATDFEGFGLVFLEAASRGLPCLGSRGSGCHEALQEGVTGLSAFPHERELLAEHMVSLLDRQLVSAEACRAWADAHSIAQQTERFLGVYAQASGN